MIKIENLTNAFRTTEVETLALNKVSLEVRDKEFVALYGTFRLWKIYLIKYYGACWIIRLRAESYFLDGKEVGSLKPKHRPYECAQGKHRFRVPKFQLD